MIRIDIQLMEIQMMRTLTAKQTNLVERNKIIVKEPPDIQLREKLDDDANQLSEDNSCVKYTEKHASLNNTIYYLS
jgi:hypothetical protein